MVQPRYNYTAYVHPPVGDDFSVNGVIVLPHEYTCNEDVVKKEIAKVLKREGSEILNDFTFNRVN